MSEQLYFGEFHHAMDKQRRVAIPSAWRGTKESPARFVVLPGRDGVVHAMPLQRAAAMLKKLSSGSVANREQRLALARIGSVAQECVCDKQGRIALSAKLVVHAGINEQAVLVGGVDSVQIWSSEAWESQQFDMDGVLDVLQEVEEGGESGLGTALSNLLSGGK